MLRAAGAPYEHLIGKIALERPEGARLVGCGAQRAGVHPGRPPRRSARRVRSRARGGALPVASQRADRSPRRSRDRRHQRPYRGSACVHPGRGRLSRLERLTRRRRDRERAALRRDPCAGARARGDNRARRGDRGRRHARGAAAGGRASGARASAGERLSPLPPRAGQRGAGASGVGARRAGGAHDAGARRARPGAGARRARVACRRAARRGRRAARAARRRAELGRRHRPGRREPGRRRDQEDPADRAADREEPDQGLLRRPRRRPWQGASSRGGRRGSGATSTGRTSCSLPSRPTRPWNGRSRPCCRARSSTARDDSLRGAATPADRR